MEYLCLFLFALKFIMNDIMKHASCAQGARPHSVTLYLPEATHTHKMAGQYAAADRWEDAKLAHIMEV